VASKARPLPPTRGLQEFHSKQTAGIFCLFHSRLWTRASCRPVEHALHSPLMTKALPTLILISALAFNASAQDYPYDDSSSSENPASLPVEMPSPAAPGTSPTRPTQKATSLFRMGLKGGGNFTSFQDRVCTQASDSGCVEYFNRTYTGVGFEGRIGFGWDLAYQPVFIETEIAYLHKMANLKSPLRVVQIQQGLFHRERIGKHSLWKNGVLAVADIRIAQTGDAELSAALYPAFGVSSLVEWGAFLTQLNFYVSQFRPLRNHWSLSYLIGVRF
jgi:hypothetical protein